MWDSESKLTETCSSGWGSIISLLDDKALLKLKCFLLECEKTSSKSKLFSAKALVLNEVVSENDSIDEIARITVKME